MNLTVFNLFNNVKFRHSIVWIIITTYFIIVDPVRGTTISNLVGTPLGMVNFIISYYTLSLLVYPRFWNKNFFFLAISILTLFLFFLIYDYLLFFKIIPAMGGEVYEEFIIKNMVLNDLLLFFFVLVAANTFFFNKLAIQKLKVQNEKEKFMLLKELNFLKSQFNSHITYNFLNFCYSKIHKTSPETADAIDLFSSILRYSLLKNPDEKISLKEEVEYINNFIDLQRLLTDSVFVDLRVSDKEGLDMVNIHPRILIAFVENAFKHGAANDPNDPIRITMDLTNKDLRFSVENRIIKNGTYKPSGIGQENVKQVLDIFYKSKYDLAIEKSGGYYSSTLKISL